MSLAVPVPRMRAKQGNDIERELDVLVISPCDVPDANVVIAAGRVGALGVLDLTSFDRAALDEVLSRYPGNIGVRLREPVELPDRVTHVVVDGPHDASLFGDRRVIAQVVSLEEATRAVAQGAHAVIAKGSESGGRVGDETTYVLLQQLVRALDVPIYAQGGIGLHTSAGAIAGGAAGVVIDSQVALCRESRLPDATKRAIAAMDGSETTLVGDLRVYTRPDLVTTEAPLGADLKTNLVALGQEAAFAKSLAERFLTVGGVVTAIRDSIEHHLRAAKELDPLAPGSPLAEAHGVRYPIAQGPMTRVSDRVAFADAVADGGGLPFLALALLRGPQVRELLDEAKVKLAGKKWGVGILGFVPADLREEQLAVIADVKPPLAIIAGGRPSQARPLEAQGTVAYLHVPSPGLLDLFLKDGARRFVFEGRECGGHVGPRSSFALWEAQIERLLAFDKPEELHLLFAGGVHDARSAAMVAAIAAPLAERGAKIGVLMGTAYLFTHEAVTSGAIQPTFQAEAMRCERTVLLETAPGHATRCVESEFVRAFRAEKLRLEAEGTDPKAIWAALEQLNLGRLRIASKGLVRSESGALETVDEATQLRDGMYMIGQVATLRHALCSVEELHAEVSAGSTKHLATLSLPTAEKEDAKPSRIAIVGMACVYPGARDLEEYWSNIVNGVSSVTEVPTERWNPETYYDATSMNGEKTPSKWGGFLPEIAFDPLAYGIPPKSLASIEPVQLLALEVAKRALDDAGYATRTFARERASVIFGAEAGTDLSGAYGFRALFPQYAGEMSKELDEHLPTLTEDSFPGILANVIAGRIANRLDLGGVNYTVDAACAASLAAMDLAVKELENGVSDMVLCGGADLHNGINDYLMFASVHALSRTGQCRTFDAKADGIALGEGVACVVLKRLEDAERDGDRVYAVIQGIGGSSDGRSLGLTAPRKEGQIRALERAYSRSGVSPKDVGLVEAHGTGTVVGDRTEIATLADVYVKAGAAKGSATLGSVKSQIGHTKCAAGLAGLIKVALAIHRRTLPPTLHVETPSSAYDPSTSPFVFSSTSRPWASEDRKAAVSAFGFGGTNFHAVIESHRGDETPEAGLAAWDAELFVFRGATVDEARERAKRLLDAIADESLRMRDLARTICDGAGEVRFAVVAGSTKELAERIALALDHRSSEGVFVRKDGEVGKVAFLFPGQGSQRPGMLRDLFLAFPRLQRFLELGPHLEGAIFPGSAFTPEARAAQAAAVTDTRVAQPALGIVDLAMNALLRSVGVVPELAGGHSYGELVALTVAGAVQEDDLVMLSGARAASILFAAGDDKGKMAAVSGGPEAVRAALEGVEGVVLANENSPKQTVISGGSAAIDRALVVLAEKKIAARAIPVACAFHSPIVAGASQSFANVLAAVNVSAPSFPVYSNTTAERYPESPDAIRARLAEHVREPVRFVSQLEKMYEDGARVFVEVGPGRVLTGLVRATLGDKVHTIATDEGGKHGIRTFLSALGELAALGVPVDTTALFRGRDAELLDLVKPKSRKPKKGTWLVNGHLAKPLDGELPVGGLRPVKEPLMTLARNAPPAPEAPKLGDREVAVVEFLRNMREMVNAQRDVLLSYLGTEPVQVAPVARRVIEMAPTVQVAAPVPVAAAPAPKAKVQEKVEDALLDIVSAKTGYPLEMLGLDLDLEAELSIDSIKRVEILGSLGARLGFGGEGAEDRDQVIEELAAKKTLRSMIEWLEKRGLAGSSPKNGTESHDPSPAPVAEEVAPIQGARFPLRRFVPRPERAPDAVMHNRVSLIGKTFAIASDSGEVAVHLEKLLAAQGATPRRVTRPEDVDGVDGLVHLRALDPGVLDPAKDLFELAQRAVLSGTSFVVGVTGLGGSFGHRGEGVAPNGRALPAGVAGLLKSLAKERPDVRACAVDVSLKDDAEEIAEEILAELLSSDGLVEVGYVRGERRALSPVRVDATLGAALPLDAQSVVLVIGGARGITAHASIELAKRTKCRIVLVGRSAPPNGVTPHENAADMLALRKALLAEGTLKEPKLVEAEAKRILGEREIRATLDAIRGHGSQVDYVSLDVRDGDAVKALVAQLYETHGRIDGVIHGAGVIEDKLLRQKTLDSFSRVYDTKVIPARALCDSLRKDVKFVVFFSSVSSAFGNRGQLDYAAANDVLDKIALDLRGRVDGRVLTINWGPWAGTGMVTEELEREYEKKGVGLIPLAEGVALLMNELTRPAAEEAQVIAMCAEPSALS